MPRTMIDMVGMVLSGTRVIKRVPNTSRTQRGSQFQCICQCGKVFERLGSALRQGRHSCGCRIGQTNKARAIPATDRFWAKVDKSGECWIWTGNTNKAKRGYWATRGYGLFHITRNDRAVYTHRYSWMLANGPVPRGACVLHRCDNPRCVRPDHLFLGTKKENTADALAKGRLTKAADGRFTHSGDHSSHRNQSQPFPK